MDLLIETLERLKYLYTKTGLSAGKLTRVGLMPKWTAVIGTDRQCGITLNFTEHQHIFGKPFVDTERLRSFIGADLFKVAEYYTKSSGLLERSVGASTVSALSQPLLTPESLEQRGYHILDDKTGFPGLLIPDDIAVMVGYGGRALDLVPGKCREFHVTDIRPRKDFHTLIIDSDIYYVPTNMIIHPAEDNAEVISRATAVLITGATLVNGTLEDLLKSASRARLVYVWGPSASVIPDVLFERGVKYLETYYISDPRAFELDLLNNKWDLKSVLPKSQKTLIITGKVKL
jgi:uncharacterized protein